MATLARPAMAAARSTPRKGGRPRIEMCPEGRIRNLTFALLAGIHGERTEDIAGAAGVSRRTVQAAIRRVKAHPELYTGRGA